MKTLTILFVCTAMSAFVACAHVQERPIRAVVMLSGDATITGTVHFTQNACGHPVLVEVMVRGLNTSGHGFHIHETGDLSSGCASLARHYNPRQLHHGGPEDGVRHVGDLGNIVGDENGLSNVRFSDDSISLAGPGNIVGRGVIVHLNIDDLGRGGHADSLTTGNAGPRVACGVIGYVNEYEPFECTRSSANTLSSAVLPFLTLLALVFKELN